MSVKAEVLATTRFSPWSVTFLHRWSDSRVSEPTKQQKGGKRWGGCQNSSRKQVKIKGRAATPHPGCASTRARLQRTEGVETFDGSVGEVLAKGEIEGGERGCHRRRPYHTHPVVGQRGTLCQTQIGEPGPSTEHNGKVAVGHLRK